MNHIASPDYGPGSASTSTVTAAGNMHVEQVTGEL